jgi:hypothetical protein
VVVSALGAGLMEPTPARPVQDGRRWGQDPHDQAIDESAHFGDGERDQRAELNHEIPFLPAAPGSRARTTARYASASMAKVMWRYQP